MTGNQVRDLVERSGWTFLQAFFGGQAVDSVIAGLTGADPIGQLQLMAMAGAASLFSFLKTVAKRRMEELDARNPSLWTAQDEP